MFVRSIAFISLPLVALTSLLAAGGELDPSQSEWYAHYSKQANAPKPEAMLLNEESEPQLNDGFKSLFNGKDLTGWTAKGGTCKFTVEDGSIVGTCVPDSPSTYLCTDKSDYRDFIFSCEMKWIEDGNSGVMFRAKIKSTDKNPETIFGPQAEMEGINKDRGWSGGIYGQSCGGYFYPVWLKEHQAARNALKKEGWNRLTISAQENVVKTWVNGVPVAHWVDDGSYPQGYFGLQIHKGQQGKVLWRDLKIKELP